MSANKKLETLNLTLPPAPQAVGVYKPALIVGKMLYTSGHLPLLPDGSVMTGCVGKDADEKAGFDAARQSGLTILATLIHHLASLEKIARVVKIFGLVNCTADFTGQPTVINGCSELMRAVFGDDDGVGTRSAVGANSLPLGAMVEIEAIFELKE